MTDRDFAVATVTNYEYDADGNIFKSRLTIAPSMVQFLTADDFSSVTVDGRELRNVTVSLVDGIQLKLLISELDLIVIERGVGSYYL